MGFEHVPRSEKTEGAIHCALLTGAFEMGDPFYPHSPIHGWASARL